MLILWKSEPSYSVIIHLEEDTEICSLHLTHSLLRSSWQQLRSALGTDPALHQCVWLRALTEYYVLG